MRGVNLKISPIIRRKAIIELSGCKDFGFNLDGITRWGGDPNNKPTEEQIQNKIQEYVDAEPMRQLREERNERLAETDWTQGRDVTLSNDSDWKNYRQTLRDFPSTASPKLDEQGILTNVTWATKPEEDI